MIAFSPLRTRRLEVRLHELDLGSEIALCHLPENHHEKAMSEFLAYAVEVAAAPSERHLANPRQWSVGERILALAHYCTHVREDGPDYAVTDVSKLSDYLDFARDIVDAPPSFAAVDDRWQLLPLSGAAAEAIEALQGNTGLVGREHWIVGAMAAQLVRENESSPPPDPIAAFADYTTWLVHRMAVLKAMPSSGFTQLFSAWRAALEASTPFFRIWFDETGVIVLPLTTKEAGALLPPARFRVLSAIGSIALLLTGKSF
jgi:hypothetical protein